MQRSLFNLLAAALLLAGGSAHAAMVETAVDYQSGGHSFRGYAIHDAAVKKQRPLVVLVPNWLGTSAANRKQAAQIAGQDYVVFVADMYGKDQQPADSAAAGKATAAVYADRAELRRRIAAAKGEAIRYAGAARLPADTRRVAAIGFCFGGAVVLELARSGDDVAAVVSFHGGLALEGPAQNQPIKTRILALHGDADPFVPAAQVNAFEDEMRAANADWQLVRFGGAVHSFTDPDASMPGKAQYDPKVARRAFAMMKDFLAEAFQ